MIKPHKKIALLELPETKGVLFDALVTFIGEARGEEVDEIHLAEMADALIFSLKRKYTSEILKKNSISTQIDLEDSIKDIKSHPNYEKQKKSWELGKQKLNQDDFEIKDTKDGTEQTDNNRRSSTATK